MVKKREKYNVGDLVWGLVTGFPWWPGRIVSPDESILGPSYKLPPTSKNSYMVKFFNDNGRVVKVNHSDLRPFLNPRYQKIHVGYSGVLNEHLNEAVREAREVASSQGLKYAVPNAYGKTNNGSATGKKNNANANGKKKNANANGKTNNAPAIGKDNNASAIGKVSSGSGTGNNNNGSANGKKNNGNANGKKNNGSVAEKNSNGSVNAKKNTGNTSGEKNNGNGNGEKKGGSAKGKKRKRAASTPTPARNVKAKVNEQDKKQHPQQSEVPPPNSTPGPSTPHLGRLQRYPEDESEPIALWQSFPQAKHSPSPLVNGRTPGGRVLRSMARANQRESTASKRNTPGAPGPSTWQSNQSQRTNPEHTATGCDNNEGAVSMEVAAIRDMACSGDLSNQQLYTSESKSTLIYLVTAYEQELRFFRLQGLRIAAQSSPEVVTKLEDFIWICAPAFEDIEEFITMSKNGADKGETDRAEKKAVEKLRKLANRPVQQSVLRSQRAVMRRGIKLASEALPYSKTVAVFMRNLCIQWLDLAGDPSPPRVAVPRNFGASP